MLQRIQSVWLFFATAALFSLFLFPYINVLNADGSAKSIKVTGVYETVNNQVVQTQDFLTITIATVILALLPFTIIFLFKNRKRQITLAYLAILAILGFTFWLVQAAKSVIGDFKLEVENYGLGVILPSLAILFLILAIRGIKRDQNLIKSADRLR